MKRSLLFSHVNSLVRIGVLLLVSTLLLGDHVSHASPTSAAGWRSLSHTETEEPPLGADSQVPVPLKKSNHTTPDFLTQEEEELIREKVRLEELTTGVLFMIMLIFLGGTFFLTLEKRIPLPHTVVLFLYGIVVGLITLWIYPDVGMTLGDIPPDLLFFIFLPVLIFEGSYAMNTFAFRRVIWQTVLLATVGIVINTGFLSVAAKLMFAEWSWYTACLMGSLLSATDPVAVVSLLKNLRVDKYLTAMVDGEAVMNDGTAIIIFTILMPAEQNGHLTQSAGMLIATGARLLLLPVILGPIFGYIQFFWLRQTHDPLTKACVTVSVSYVSYYIAYAYVGTSGVLTLCFEAVFLSWFYPSLFPGKESNFVSATWEFLVHLSNTVLFSLVGVILVADVLSTVRMVDMFFIALLYIVMVLARFAMLEIMLPLINRFPRKMNQQEVLLLTHAGLRGGVAVTLALAVKQKDSEHGVAILKLTSGVVLLTLIINATTSSFVVEHLGFKVKEEYRHIEMKYGMRYIKDTEMRALEAVKRDTKYKNTNWHLVEKYLSKHLKNPYRDVGMIVEGEELSLNRLTMSAFKASLWRQRDELVISETVIQQLTSLANELIEKGELLDVRRLSLYYRREGAGGEEEANAVGNNASAGDSGQPSSTARRVQQNQLHPQRQSRTGKLPEKKKKSKESLIGSPNTNDMKASLRSFPNESNKQTTPTSPLEREGVRRHLDSHLNQEEDLAMSGDHNRLPHETGTTSSRSNGKRKELVLGESFDRSDAPPGLHHHHQRITSNSATHHVVLSPNSDMPPHHETPHVSRLNSEVSGASQPQPLTSTGKALMQSFSMLLPRLDGANGGSHPQVVPSENSVRRQRKQQKRATMVSSGGTDDDDDDDDTWDGVATDEEGPLGLDVDVEEGPGPTQEEVAEEEERGDETAMNLMKRLLPKWVLLAERVVGNGFFESAHRRAQENGFMTVLAIVKCLTSLANIKYQHVTSPEQARRINSWLQEQLREANACINFFYNHFPEATNYVSSTRAVLSVAHSIQEAIDVLHLQHGFGTKMTEMLDGLVAELRDHLPKSWGAKNDHQKEADLVMRAVASTSLGRGLRRAEISAIASMGLVRKFKEGDVITLPTNAFLVVVFGSLRTLRHPWTTAHADHNLMENFGDTVGLDAFLFPRALRVVERRRWEVITGEATALLISFQSIQPFLTERSLRAVKALWRAAAVEAILPLLQEMITLLDVGNAREHLMGMVMAGTPLIGPDDCNRFEWSTPFHLCFYLRGSDSRGFYTQDSPPAHVSTFFLNQVVWTSADVVLYVVPVNISDGGYVPWGKAATPGINVSSTSTAASKGGSGLGGCCTNSSGGRGSRRADGNGGDGGGVAPKKGERLKPLPHHRKSKRGRTKSKSHSPSTSTPIPTSAGFGPIHHAWSGGSGSSTPIARASPNSSARKHHSPQRPGGPHTPNERSRSGVINTSPNITYRPEPAGSPPPPLTGLAGRLVMNESGGAVFRSLSSSTSERLASGMPSESHHPHHQDSSSKAMLPIITGVATRYPSHRSTQEDEPVHLRESGVDTPPEKYIPETNVNPSSFVLATESAPFGGGSIVDRLTPASSIGATAAGVGANRKRFSSAPAGGDVGTLVDGTETIESMNDPTNSFAYLRKPIHRFPNGRRSETVADVAEAAAVAEVADAAAAAASDSATFATAMRVLGKVLMGVIPMDADGNEDAGVAPGDASELLAATLDASTNFGSPMNLSNLPRWRADATGTGRFGEGRCCVVQSFAHFVSPVPLMNQLFASYASMLEQLCIAALRYVLMPSDMLNIRHAQRVGDRTVEFLMKFGMELHLIQQAIECVYQRHGLHSHSPMYHSSYRPPSTQGMAGGSLVDVQRYKSPTTPNGVPGGEFSHSHPPGYVLPTLGAGGRSTTSQLPNSNGAMEDGFWADGKAIDATFHIKVCLWASQGDRCGRYHLRSMILSMRAYANRRFEAIVHSLRQAVLLQPELSKVENVENLQAFLPQYGSANSHNPTNNTLSPMAGGLNSGSFSLGTPGVATGAGGMANPTTTTTTTSISATTSHRRAGAVAVDGARDTAPSSRTSSVAPTPSERSTVYPHHHNGSNRDSDFGAAAPSSFIIGASVDSRKSNTGAIKRQQQKDAGGLITFPLLPSELMEKERSASSDRQEAFHVERENNNPEREEEGLHNADHKSNTNNNNTTPLTARPSESFPKE